MSGWYGGAMGGLPFRWARCKIHFMKRRRQPTASPAPVDLAAYYHVLPHERGLRLAPVNHLGPGRSALLSRWLAGILAVVCSSGGVTCALIFQVKFAANPVGPPTWLAWFVPAGWLLFPLGGLALAGCLKLVVQARRALLIAPSVGVCYGKTTLVAPGEVMAVRLERCSQWVRGESGPSYERRWTHLYLATTEGDFVELPRPFFSDLEGWDVGELLARSIATTLAVPWSAEPIPASASTPERHARRWRSVWRVVALVVGVPHFLFGFGMLVAHVGDALRLIRLPADAPPAWLAALFVGSGSLACWFGSATWGRWGKLLFALALVATLVLLLLRRD